MSESRLHVPDPDLMRRAFTRMVVALVFLVVLTAFFIIGGITLLANGEVPGLPLAVGGLVLLLGCVVLVATTRRVRRSLREQTISREALSAARRAAIMVRRTAILAAVALLVFGLVRIAFGDGWSLLTAAVMSVGLWLLARGGNTMRKAHDQALA
jgi:hypothetical protein